MDSRQYQNFIAESKRYNFVMGLTEEELQKLETHVTKIVAEYEESWMKTAPEFRDLHTLMLDHDQLLIFYALIERGRFERANKTL